MTDTERKTNKLKQILELPVGVSRWRRPLKDVLAAVGFLTVSILLIFASIWAYNQYITSPPYVDSERFPIKGIDVSAHNGMMNLDAAAKDGIEFVFIKATEGESFRDANFALNYLKAGHAGMMRGAYHFFRFDVDGIKQAENLLKAVAGRPLELGLVIDVEQSGNPEGIHPDTIAKRLQDMTDFLILKGRRVTFYSNRDGYDNFVFPTVPGYPLWICSFVDENARRNDWTYWQYDHHGKVSGIRGDVDMNVFYGSRREWQEFTKYPNK